MTISFLTILCSLCAWGLVVGVICSAGVALVEGWKYLHRIHQVPCSRCIYFTGDYSLKCTVRPCAALTEQAIGCADYEPEQSDRRRFRNPAPKHLWKYFQPFKAAPSSSLSATSLD